MKKDDFFFWLIIFDPVSEIQFGMSLVEIKVGEGITKQNKLN